MIDFIPREDATSVPHVEHYLRIWEICSGFTGVKMGFLKNEQLKTVRSRRGKRGRKRQRGSEIKDEGGFGRSTTRRDSKRNKEVFLNVNFDMLQIMRPRQCGL